MSNKRTAKPLDEEGSKEKKPKTQQQEEKQHESTHKEDKNLSLELDWGTKYSTADIISQITLKNPHAFIFHEENSCAGEGTDTSLTFFKTFEELMGCFEDGIKNIVEYGNDSDTGVNISLNDDEFYLNYIFTGDHNSDSRYDLRMKPVDEDQLKTIEKKLKDGGVEY